MKKLIKNWGKWLVLAVAIFVVVRVNCYNSFDLKSAISKKITNITKQKESNNVQVNTNININTKIVINQL